MPFIHLIWYDRLASQLKQHNSCLYTLPAFIRDLDTGLFSRALMAAPLLSLHLDASFDVFYALLCLDRHTFDLLDRFALDEHHDAANACNDACKRDE